MTSVLISTLSGDAKELRAWDEFVMQQGDASIYHLSAWRSVVETVFGHQCYYYYASNQSGQLQAVLPLVRLRSRLFGDYMVSMPYFNYGGALGLNADAELALMQYAAQAAEQHGADHIEFRDGKLRPGYEVKNDKVSMLLSLPDSEQELWKQLGAKRRAQIKRPLRENPDIKEGSIELLDDFYKVFAQNMRDLGTPVYAKRFFESMLEAFPDQSRLLLIYLNSKPVGAAFLLGYKDKLEIPWASTLKEVNSLSINMLMYWEVLRFAFRRSYKFFDFGRCTVESGTYRFKKQWGASPVPCYWHYWMPGSQAMPELNPNNPKYKLAISVWKKLPLFVTKLLGPKIVKNLP